MAFCVLEISKYNKLVQKINDLEKGFADIKNILNDISNNKYSELIKFNAVKLNGHKYELANEFIAFCRLFNFDAKLVNDKILITDLSFSFNKTSDELKNRFTNALHSNNQYKNIDINNFSFNGKEGAVIACGSNPYRGSFIPESETSISNSGMKRAGDNLWGSLIPESETLVSDHGIKRGGNPLWGSLIPESETLVSDHGIKQGGIWENIANNFYQSGFGQKKHKHNDTHIGFNSITPNYVGANIFAEQSITPNHVGANIFAPQSITFSNQERLPACSANIARTSEQNLTKNNPFSAFSQGTNTNNTINNTNDFQNTINNAFPSLNTINDETVSTNNNYHSYHSEDYDDI